MPIWTSNDIAKIIIQVGNELGITRRGIIIGLSVGLVESNLTVYANSRIPESLALPHDAVGSDGYSVGVQQQQIQKGDNGHWWWADCKTCMDPASSTRLFFEALKKLDYNGSNSPGSYAQAVQRSAYPTRYDERWAEASSLYDSLVTSGVSAVVNAPAFRDVELMGNNRQSRNGASILYIFLHTEEGSSTAEQLVNSGNNSGAFSYHNIIDKNTRVAMVDTDYASWSVLDANNYSINYCFAGSRASFSRQQWIDGYRNAIRIAAYTAVEDCKKYNRIGRVVNRGTGYPKGKIPCIADHYFVTKVLSIGTHTDVGVNFPWDLFESDFNAYLSGVSAAPVENMINKEAARAAAWIGKRVSPTGATDEHTCPDGKGKFVQFENGYIYFHPNAGAHAIPAYIFETWASLKWETGPLGYPTGDHTVLKEGVVQGFERGAIYRKNGQPGWFVTGDIRAHWNRSGYEDGLYGWPVGNEITNKSGTKYQIFEKGRLVWSPDKVVGLVPQDGPDIIN